MFRLAGYLGKTVGEIERTMSSRELSEWVAYSRYFQAIPDQWRQTGLLASALLAPYCPRGKTPKAEDFVPLEKPPQHQEQIRQQLMSFVQALQAE